MGKRHPYWLPWWATTLSTLALLITLFYILERSRIPIDGVGSIGVDGHCLVTQVVKNGPGERAGIQLFDIIESIGNSNPITIHHAYAYSSYRAGESAIYAILRNHQHITLTVTFGSYLSYQPWFYLLFYFLIVLVILTGLFILKKRPADPSAKLFFIYLQLFAVSQNTAFLFSDSPVASISNTIFSLSFNLFGVVLIHFHLLFPQRAAIFHKIKPLLVLMYVLGLLFGVVATANILIHNYSISVFAHDFFHSILRWSVAWMSLTLLLALLIAFYQYMTICDPHSRKQLQLVVIGSLFGLVTPIVFGFNPYYFWGITQKFHAQTFVEIPHTLGSILMIYFIAIAIFRYKIWDIEPVIKKAILYLLITTLIILFYIPLVWITGFWIQHQENSLQYFILAISLIIAFISRDYLQGIVDRLFFRQHYDPTKVVSQFEEALSGVYQEEEIHEEIYRRVLQIFPSDSFSLYLRNENARKQYRLCKSSSPQSDLKEGLISEELEGALRKQQPFALETIPSTDRFIHPWDGELLIPMNHGDEPYGFMILGRKRSEQSYTLQDVTLLTILSKRMVALYQTAHLYRKDLERHMLLERERTRISQDMHDEVGASLTQISILSEVLKRKQSNTGESSRLVNQIAEISSSVVDDMSDIIWAMNPVHDNLDSFSYYVRKHLLEYLANTPLKATLETPSHGQYVALSSEQRRNLFLVIKEALHNTVKYANANTVTLLLEYSNGTVKLFYSDDGVGFNPEDVKQEGNGLRNMRLRMESLGGFYRIESSKGNGTRIHAEIPLHKN